MTGTEEIEWTDIVPAGTETAPATLRVTSSGRNKVLLIVLSIRPAALEGVTPAQVAALEKGAHVQLAFADTGTRYGLRLRRDDDGPFKVGISAKGETRIIRAGAPEDLFDEPLDKMPLEMAPAAQSGDDLIFWLPEDLAPYVPRVRAAGASPGIQSLTRPVSATEKPSQVAKRGGDSEA